MEQRKAFIGNAPHVKVTPESLVCVFTDCNADPNPELSAPLCMDHAKMLTVQVMLLTNTSVKTSSKRMAGTANVKKFTDPYSEDAKSRNGLIYFAQFGDRIKIGFSTDVTGRMKSIPHDKVLALIPGSFASERALHKKFDAIRITGEWFANDPRLTSYIATLPVHERLAA